MFQKRFNRILIYLILGRVVGPSDGHVLESVAPRGVRTQDLEAAAEPSVIQAGDRRRNAYTQPTHQTS
jgi:hypothetical protein